MSNIVKDELCNYGFYAKKEGLAMDLNEYDCTKLGTKTCVYEGSPLMFCDEHYPLVAAKNQQSTIADKLMIDNKVKILPSKLYLNNIIYDVQGCKGICSRHKAMRPNTGNRYLIGQKRCQVCQVFIYWQGLFCPCCGCRLRNKPRNRKFKLILNNIKNNK